MKCYYFTDPKTGKKHLIPGCYQVVHSNDKTDCTCSLPSYKGENKNFKIIEAELKEYIKTLEAENKKLLNQTKL